MCDDHDRQNGNGATGTWSLSGEDGEHATGTWSLRLTVGRERGMNHAIMESAKFLEKNKCFAVMADTM